ncbi:zinc finger protein 511 isoform X2 [Ahaetulla prasina]|uniref:zinc finger protein 511 isoform X2 n=1 Tax=Ahaetulla prasina TaxID=499056 RepID=UPI00264866B5|nr:zinc finger protein 511 isoform X2 [Ahaetulla prasina]
MAVNAVLFLSRMATSTGICTSKVSWRMSRGTRKGPGEDWGEVPPPFLTSEFSCQIGGCSQVFNTLESFEHHYNMLHRNVCSSCKRAFPSTHLLDVHILEWHDSLFQIMAEKQNMYQCLVESCPEKFKSSKDRKEHLITVHQYPSNFRFDKSLKAQRKEKMRPSSKESNVPMDMTLEDSEQSHAEAMEIGPDESIMESDFQSECTECTVDSPAFGKRQYRSRLVALLFSVGLESPFGMNICLTLHGKIYLFKN